MVTIRCLFYWMNTKFRANVLRVFIKIWLQIIISWTFVFTKSKNFNNPLNCFYIYAVLILNIIAATAEGRIRMFTNLIAPIYNKDNLRKKRRRTLAHQICFSPTPFPILPLANEVAHFLETLKGGYACVFQTFFQLQLICIQLTN